MSSVLDPFYSILASFFPAGLIAIPFFNFLLNLFAFCFCCWIFCLFLVFPLNAMFKWFKDKVIKE